LKDFFLELFCLARNRDTMVANLMSVGNDTAPWDVNFTRLIHDWEMKYVSSFFNVCALLEWVRRVMIGPKRKRSFEVETLFKFFLMVFTLSP
jgi:hypothetical protein